MPQFDVKCVVNLIRKETESPQELRVEDIKRNFSEALVNVHLSRKNRIVQRLIHSIKAKTTDGGAKAELLIVVRGRSSAEETRDWPGRQRRAKPVQHAFTIPD